jgi:hypothetical protein
MLAGFKVPCERLLLSIFFFLVRGREESVFSRGVHYGIISKASILKKKGDFLNQK